MIDLKLEERLFSSYTISFGLPEDDPKTADLIVDSITKYRGETFFITNVWKEHLEDGSRIVRVEGEAWWMRLVELKKPGTTYVLSTNVVDGLTTILQGTGWTVGEDTENSTEGYFAEATDSTVLGLIWQWAKVTDKEVLFDNRAKKVSLVEDTGILLPVRFIYDRNMRSIERHIQPPLITRLYPFGKNDLSIKDVNAGVSYIEDYSYYTALGLTLAEARALHRKDEIYNDPSVADVEVLMRRAQRLLAANSGRRVTYDAKVVDVSSMSDMPWDEYKAGDYVSVYDTPLNIDTNARISRIVKYPHNPEKNEIELSFAPILIPDNQASTARAQPFQSWEMFYARNEGTPRQVRQGYTILARLDLRTTEDAEWIVGFSLSGSMVGTGTLTIDCEDDALETVIWDSQVVPIVNGEQYTFNFSYGQKNIPAGEYTLVVRATSNGSTAGIDIPADSVGMWVLARNTVKLSPTLTNSIRYDWTDNVQYFEVPDDVSVVQIEAHGGAGGTGNADSNGGKGGKVVAKYPVIAGTTYSVWVGGIGTDGNDGTPNGGAGSSYNNPAEGGGGSSSVQDYIVPASSSRPDELTAFLATLPSALIVAAGGGGGGDGFFQTPNHGGDGGFYQGSLNSDATGTAATQLAGGTTPDGVANPGLNGSFGQGGGLGNGGATASAEGGGGGGGWYGGYACGGTGSWGTLPGGGSGGSGKVNSDAFDLDFLNGENTGAGYVIISWEVDEP